MKYMMNYWHHWWSFLNNVLDYNGKQRIIEEYGFDTKKIESEVKDICDLGESIALEARNEGKQIERKEKNIAHVKTNDRITNVI